MTCKQMLTITYATSGPLKDSYPHRIDICRDEIHERLRKLEASNIDEDEDEPEKD